MGRERRDEMKKSAYGSDIEGSMFKKLKLPGPKFKKASHPKSKMGKTANLAKVLKKANRGK